MAISAIIRCHLDDRVCDLVEALRGPGLEYEIVVVLTEASDALRDRLLGRDRVKVCRAPAGNLSMSTNMGIEASRYDRVVILDADVRCSPDYLRHMDNALDRSALVRSDIEFAHSGFGSRLVADLRHYVYHSGVFFCPGAAFRKDIKPLVGGRFFNDRVWWTEDADLNYRIKQAGLRHRFEPAARLVHAPVSVTYDLRGAVKIGAGKFSQVLYADRRSFEESPRAVLGRLLSGRTARQLADIARSKGVFVAVYFVLFSFAYYYGYYRALFAARRRGVAVRHPV
jgi:glycosyltransferase involved in cell wall biosynthesis